MKLKQSAFILILWTFSKIAFGQTLPLGFPVLEEAFRRQQLTENFDPAISFSVRPISYDYSDSADTGIHTSAVQYRFGKFMILPIHVSSEINSHHPHPSYNGAMLPGKGLQSIVSIGAAGKLGPIEFQLRPEFYYSQNKNYDGYPLEVPKGWPNHRRWPYMYRWWNNIDTPEKFGDGAIKDILPGQSYISLNLANIELSVSNQSLWWGPGKYNSLLMTNNARGFNHLSINTTNPVHTPIGSFESQLIAGKLKPSGFFPPDTGRVASNARLYVPKPNENRYLNGLIVTYSPKWTPGLHLGFIRTVQMYSSTANAYNDYVPVIADIFRSKEYLGDSIVSSSLASVFMRWSMKNSEVYFEYGRNNTSWKLSDLISAPQQDAAYIFGFTRLVPLNKPNRYLEFNVEMTKLQQPPDYIIHLAKPQSWYAHDVVRHGYTHSGEVIGSKVGPGGNMQVLEAGWVYGLKKISFLFERIVHNNDFNYTVFYGSQGGDFRSYWVDYSLGLNTNWSFKKVLISGTAQYTRTLNYQWETYPGYNYFDKGSGADVDNFFFKLNTAYIF